MTKRNGFTLAELVLALFIFSFMSMSLATIYATANRHMFQNYRRNIIKTNADFAMKAIQNTLSMATRIDFPAVGAVGNTLAFATNVDQMNGCYPISAADPVAWHYFCVTPDATLPAVNDLYYHTGTIAGGAGCPPAAGFNYTPPYPAFCGPGGGGTVMLLMQYVIPLAPPSSQFAFSRSAVDGINENTDVRVMLRSYWNAANRGFGSSQRDIDFTLDTVTTVNRTK